MKKGTRKPRNSIPAFLVPRNLRAETEKRAYEIWHKEGGVHGRDLDHWLRAEHELVISANSTSCGDNNSQEH
jgi:hypothetical protein